MSLDLSVSPVHGAEERALGPLLGHVIAGDLDEPSGLPLAGPVGGEHAVSPEPVPTLPDVLPEVHFVPSPELPRPSRAWCPGRPVLVGANHVGGHRDGLLGGANPLGPTVPLGNTAIGI